jgi:membrane-associated phospholipid phosphatase
MLSGVEDDRQFLFLLTAAGLVLMLALPPLFGFNVDYASFTPIYLLIAAPVLALPYVAWRRLDAMRPALEAMIAGLLLTLPVLVSTYAAMRTGLPLADPLLKRMDAALGFDWLAFVRFADGNAFISRLLGYGYGSFSFQLLLLPCLLCVARQYARAYRFVSAYFVLCIISSMISAFFPSVGAFEGHGLRISDLTYLNGYYGHVFIESFNAVREDPAFVLRLGETAGIVTFPSVHVGVAALCAWAAWPSRILRWPFAALNLVMTVSAITNGGHYLADVLAGGLIAATTICLVNYGVVSLRARRASWSSRGQPLIA